MRTLERREKSCFLWILTSKKRKTQEKKNRWLQKTGVKFNRDEKEGRRSLGNVRMEKVKRSNFLKVAEKKGSLRN